MKVYYNGLNLHHQFPNVQKLVENFVDHKYENLANIEVSYHYVVLLVADTIVIQGAKNEKIQIEKEIAHIMCTEDKILALLTNGELVKITNCVQNVPKLMDLDDDDRIDQVSCGSKLTVALTKRGKLYNIPNKLDFENNDIISVKTGREHCLLLDRRGNVFSFGRGSRGQLGRGCLEDESEPKFIEALGGVKIEVIEADGWHSCALSKDGDLYTWGWNCNGQLGLSDNDAVSVMATPHVVNLDFNVTKVACGTRHTVVLSDKGLLYGCGWNKYKQLKNDDKESFYQMTFLGDFSKDVVKGLKCGPWNTLLLCEE